MNMVSPQNDFRLVVFKFKYVDCYCVWPIFFIADRTVDYGAEGIDYFNKAIFELNSIPGITDIKKVYDKQTNIGECMEIIDYVLKEKDGTLINREDSKIKYLEIEQQKLSDTPKYDFNTNSFYTPLLIRGSKFPVRIRSDYFKFLLDDIELPLLVIN